MGLAMLIKSSLRVWAGLPLQEADRRCEGRPRLSAERPEVTVEQLQAGSYLNIRSRLNAFQRSRIKNAWWILASRCPRSCVRVWTTLSLESLCKSAKDVVVPC